MLAHAATQVAGAYPELFRHQTAGVAFLLSRRRAILADDMGLGKTRTAIVAAARGAPRRAVPGDLPGVGQAQLAARDPARRAATPTSRSSPRQRPFEPGHRWTVVNYDLVAATATASPPMHWAVVIVDEAHYIKNDSVRSSAPSSCSAPLASRRRRPEHVYLLTGTPMANRPRDLFNLLKAVRHPLAKSFYGYAKRYCAAYDNGYGLDTNGASNVDELAAIVSGVMLRRTKGEALDLPEKVRSWVPVDCRSTRIRSRREAGPRLPRASNPARSGSTWITFLGLLNRARHDLAVAKARATADFVTDCVEAGQKVVVFTSYTGVVDRCANGSATAASPSPVTTAPSPPAQPSTRFQRDDAVRVFVGNLHAAGVGITLTAGDPRRVQRPRLGAGQPLAGRGPHPPHRPDQVAPSPPTCTPPARSTTSSPRCSSRRPQTIAELEDGAGDAASLDRAVVDRALDGDDPAEHPRARALLARPWACSRRPSNCSPGSATTNSPSTPASPCSRSPATRPERRLHHNGDQRRRHLRLPRLHLRRPHCKHAREAARRVA